MKYFNFNCIGKLDLSMAEKFHQAMSHLTELFENGAYSMGRVASIIEELKGLFNEWISVDKDIQANKYGLSKMLVFIQLQRSFYADQIEK